MKRIFLPIFLIVLMTLTLQRTLAQSTTDTAKPQKALKNTITYNISAAVAFSPKNIIFGYERIIGKNQSITFHAGPAALPPLKTSAKNSTGLINIIINPDSIGLTKNKKQSGYTVSTDYRFYLGALNKYDAPRGVYLGPYMGFVHFQAEHQWSFNHDPEPSVNLTTNTAINLFTMGAQLGYQFVFWRRLTLDMNLFGPGLAIYDITAQINETVSLTPEQKERLQAKLQQALQNKFPGLNFAIQNQTFNGSGNIKSWNAGFHYALHIGFRF
jgi:hypothetical protein